MPALTRVVGAIVLTSCAVPGFGSGAAYAQTQGPVCAGAAPQPASSVSDHDHDRDRDRGRGPNQDRGRDHDHDRGPNQDHGHDHDHGRDQGRGPNQDRDHDHDQDRGRDWDHDRGRDQNRDRDHDHDRSGPDSKKIAAWQAAERTCVRAFRQDRTAQGRDCYKRYQSFTMAHGGAKTQGTPWSQMTPEQKKAARQATVKRFKDFQLKCCPDAQFPGV
ncbi:hypothetical protein [Nonomuraea cavernae]|uniref:hypothetical protein n=1 Tax=Nonomuraea cavernae TaxID=2045107 RepID=UPI0033F1D98D